MGILTGRQFVWGRLFVGVFGHSPTAALSAERASATVDGVNHKRLSEALNVRHCTEPGGCWCLNWASTKLVLYSVSVCVVVLLFVCV